jgi:polygalacturonase
MTSRAALVAVLVTALAAPACSSSSNPPKNGGQGDASLADLAVSAGALSPAFSPAVTSYAVVAPHGTATVTVTPTTSSAAAHVTVAVNGGAPAPVASGSASAALTVPPVSGSATIAVVVTTGDGSARTYTIALTQGDTHDATLSALAVSAGTLTPAFAPATTSYTVVAPNGAPSVWVTPTTNGPTATIAVAVNGGAVTPIARGDAQCVAVPAVGGSTAISLVVTAEDGVSSRTYAVALTQAPSSDASLSGLAVGAGSVAPAFAPGTTSYAVVAPPGATGLDVTPTATSAGATLTVAVNLGMPAPIASGVAARLPVPPVGSSSTISIVVTAQDGSTTRSYSITLTQASSSDATLANLAVDAGTLTPAFAAAEPSYAVTAPYGTATVDVTPTASDAGATVTVAQDGGTPTPVASGSAVSVTVPAAGGGRSTISIVVTAQDGSTKRTYTVTLTTGLEPAVTAQWGPVSAPSFPAVVCTTLVATLAPTNGSLDALDANPAASQPDRARIQAALSACPPYQAVKLVAGAGGASAFLTGPLTIKSGVTLWVDAGVTLFASRNPADYNAGSYTTCGTATSSATDPNSGKTTCNPLILANGTFDSGLVGDGVIDGRGGSRLTSGPNAGIRTWWDVAYENKVAGLTQHNPRLVQVTGGGRFTLYRITVQNAPNFHVVASNVAGVTAWGIKLLSPSSVYTQPGYACPPGTTPPEGYTRSGDLTSYTGPSICFTPDTVKNTDGFDPGQSTSVVLAYSWISVGDDHVAIKAHTTGPAADITVSHNHFYYGHGMSIGSETDAGVRNVRVEDLSIDGQDSPNENGLRIKTDSSAGGPVNGITYERVCMRNVRRPLVFDPFYSSDTGPYYPWFTNIVLRDVHSLGSAPYGAGELTFAGYVTSVKSNYLGITLDGVVLDGGPPSTGASPRWPFAMGHNGGPDSPGDAVFAEGPGDVSFAAALGAYGPADGVTVNVVPPIPRTALDCSAAFPSLKTAVPTSPF